MKTNISIRGALGLAAAFLITGLAGARASSPPPPPKAASENIVSDIQGVAPSTDPQLVNPWGLVPREDGKLHVADDGTGVVSMYSPDGGYVSGSNSYVVPKGGAVSTGTTGTPTGLILNKVGLLVSGSNDFAISGTGGTAASHFIICTQDGTLDGYNENVNASSAVTEVDTTGTSGYTGLALSFAVTGTSPQPLAHRLYVANFRAGTVDVFDNNWAPVALTGSNNFTDPNLAAFSTGTTSYSPFNVKHFAYTVKDKHHTIIERRILVAYAMHSTVSPMDDIPGPGNGAVAVFTPEGQFISELVPPGTATINSPWGMAVAHGSVLGSHEHLVVMIGNHGDGTVDLYGYNETNDTATFHGSLVNRLGQPLAFDGLWALHFGAPKESLVHFAADVLELSDDPTKLFFSAGIVGESHGLVGAIVKP